MANETGELALSKQDLRHVTGYVAECAQGVREVYESLHPANSRPRAAELVAGDARSVGAEHIEQPGRLATPSVIEVLKRYPEARRGGGRVGELLRDLDQALRDRKSRLVIFSLRTPA